MSWLKQCCSWLERKVNSLTGMSLQDVEGLLIQVGIISALALTFTITIFSTVQRQEFMDADFRDDLFYYPENRALVVDLLDSKGFNFTTVRAGVPFDIRKALLEADMASFGSFSQSMQDLDFAFLSIKDQVPLHYFGVKPYQLCWWVMTAYGMSSCTLTPALLTSLFLYASISASSARERLERGDDDSWRKMTVVAVPTVMVLFALNITGICSMFVGIGLVTRVRYSWAAAAYINGFFAIKVAAPLCCLGFLLSVLALYFVESATTKEVHTKASEAAHKLLDELDDHIDKFDELPNLALLLEMEPKDLQEFGFSPSEAWNMVGYIKRVRKDFELCRDIRRVLEAEDPPMKAEDKLAEIKAPKPLQHAATTGAISKPERDEVALHLSPREPKASALVTPSDKVLATAIAGGARGKEAFSSGPPGCGLSQRTEAPTLPGVVLN